MGKKGKEGQYAYGVFKLYTATKAYRDFCYAANSAFGYVGGSNAMVLAVPSAGALFHQVEADLSSTANYKVDGDSQSKCVKLVEYSAATVAYINEAASKALVGINSPAGGLKFDSNTMFDGFQNNEMSPLLKKIV